MSLPRRPAPSLLVLAPMHSEARALSAVVSDGQVLRAGVGPRRARSTAAAAAALPAGAVAVAGLAGALQQGLEPGDVVVAERLLRRDGRCAARCAGGAPLAEEMRRRGLCAHVGPVLSVRNPVVGATRRALAETGALVVDMDSVWLAPAAAGRPLAVVRVVLDTPVHELANPWHTLIGLRRASGSLQIAAAALDEWARRLDVRH